MNLDAQLQELRIRYVRQLPKKFAEIMTLWQQLQTADNAVQRTDIYRLLHSLAGSGATYGFPEISRTARDAESLFNTDMSTARQDVTISHVDAALQALGSIMEEIVAAN